MLTVHYFYVQNVRLSPNYGVIAKFSLLLTKKTYHKPSQLSWCVYQKFSNSEHPRGILRYLGIGRSPLTCRAKLARLTAWIALSEYVKFVGQRQSFKLQFGKRNIHSVSLLILPTNGFNETYETLYNFMNNCCNILVSLNNKNKL